MITYLGKNFIWLYGHVLGHSLYAATTNNEAAVVEHADIDTKWLASALDAPI